MWHDIVTREAIVWKLVFAKMKVDDRGNPESNPVGEADLQTAKFASDNSERHDNRQIDTLAWAVTKTILRHIA